MPEDETQRPSEEQANLLQGAFQDSQDLSLALSAVDPAGDTVIVSDVQDQAETGAHPFPIVGIGASAGGVEAYIELFRNLPPDTGMAFAVISHLPADQKSHLADIISHQTAMPVTVIEEGLRPEPDHVYVMPPNVAATLQNGAFKVEARSGNGLFHPIDLFLQSLAADQKHLSIGVVLSGMDADGAIGLKSIKAEGGISFVQAPESARFPEMPRSSISADHVDMVLPPGQIASQLSVLAQRFRNPEVRRLEEGVPAREEERHFARILKLLKSVSGIDFRLYKPSTIRRRVARRMLMLRIDSLADYATLLQTASKELRELQEDILINVTRFFRDPDVFEALKTVAFPEMFRNRPADQQVRVWVAGCSSGEEVYSIAICLLEYLTGNSLEPPIQIFGTDASETGIQKARLGIYPESILAEVSPERIRRFFVKTEKGYQVAKRVRDLCIFARQNLCNDPPFSRLDLISCRNVLIYFGSRLQSQLIPTFHYALRPGGFLLLGASETIRNLSESFSLADRKHKIYAKVGDTPHRVMLDLAPRPYYLPEFAADSLPLQRSGIWGDLELQRAADRIVLARFGPPGVVVNEKLEILQSRGHTSPFLELAPGAVSLQLARMARENIAPQVVSAVKRAIEEDLPVQVEHLQVHEGERVYDTTLEVLPMHSIGSKCYLVLFVPAPSSLAPLPPEPVPAPDEKDHVISQLRHDLASTRLYLQSLLEERDAKNQELVSANEEIQSANEELQSTNEELETTKEELQSSNEELQTVNDELQNRNSVLTQASNDLSNLLNSVNLPVLMLSNHLEIRHFTPQTQRVMNVRSSDIGRPFADIRLNLQVESLELLFAGVLETLGAREMEVQDRDGHWYLLRVRPYRTTDNKIEGLVVVLVDIDQLRRSQQELRNARDFATSVIGNIPLPLVVVDSDFRIQSANDAFCALTSLNSQVLSQRVLPDLTFLLWGMEQPLRSLLEGLRQARDQAKSFEFEHRAQGEPQKTLLVRGRPLQPDGEPFVLVTFEDVTAHKEVERLLKAEGERLATEVATTTNELERSREELRALTANLLTTQEDERRRLARELHDDIGQRIAAIAINREDLMRNLGGSGSIMRAKLDRMFSQVAELSNDVRSLSHRLHPSIIEDLGLAPALQWLTEEFEAREGMITTFYADENLPPLSLEISTGLYRIAQEALRNVAKHAGKTHVKVQLLSAPGEVELQIVDAGMGFDVEQSRSGLGLISMEERARLVGGNLRVQSAVREGTRVMVRIPVSTSS